MVWIFSGGSTDKFTINISEDIIDYDIFSSSTSLKTFAELAPTSIVKVSQSCLFIVEEISWSQI